VKIKINLEHKKLNIKRNMQKYSTIIIFKKMAYKVKMDN